MKWSEAIIYLAICLMIASVVWALAWCNVNWGR